MVNILIADDHPLFRSALLAALDSLSFECVLHEAECFSDTRTKIQKMHIDLILLDLKMPGNKGLMGLAQLRSQYPHIAVVVVSATEDVNVVQDAKSMGAMGFVSKSADTQAIIDAVETVYQGQQSFPEKMYITDEKSIASKLAELTPKQLTVLNLIAEGALNKQIGYELNIKETTVKSHITDIFRKLKINNRTQAALLVQNLSVIDGDELSA